MRASPLRFVVWRGGVVGVIRGGRLRGMGLGLVQQAGTFRLMDLRGRFSSPLWFYCFVDVMITNFFVLFDMLIRVNMSYP